MRRVETPYGIAHVVFEQYPNGGTRIQLYDVEDGSPIGTVSTQVQGTEPAEGNVHLKGWSENQGLPELLVEAGIVSEATRRIPAGHAEATEHTILVDTKAWNEAVQAERGGK